MKKTTKTVCMALLSGIVLCGCSPAESSASFVPESSVGMENPWKETKDLEEAVKGSGIEFDPPEENPVPDAENPIAFFEYMYMDGVISVLYEGVDDEMIVRKSNVYEGKEALAGDYNTYSKIWEENYKGLNVTCEGNGKLISCAYFSSGDMHYSVTFDPGEEDRGLTADQLGSIIMSMQ